MQNNNLTFESQCRLLEQAELFFENGDFGANLPLEGSLHSFNTILGSPFSASGPSLQQENIQGNSVQQACSNGTPVGGRHEPHFTDQIRPYAESQLYSSSSEDFQGFYTHEILGSNIDAAQDTWYPQRSAFVKYNRSPAYNASGSDQRLAFKRSNLNLLRRCFKFLRTIDTTRSCSAVAREQAVATRSGALNFQDKAAFHHMIAERNRRVKLRQHFSYLRSILPKPCKKDKYSILSNTTWHLNELKRRIEELKQRNSSLEALFTKHSIPFKDDKSHEDPSKSIGATITSSPGSQLYQCQEVVIEQSSTGIPDQVEMRINAQNPVLTPTNSIINLLECLREFKLEMVSVQSDVRKFQFQADLQIRTQEGRWDSSRWVQVGDAVRRAVCL